MLQRYALKWIPATFIPSVHAYHIDSGPYAGMHHLSLLATCQRVTSCALLRPSLPRSHCAMPLTVTRLVFEGHEVLGEGVVGECLSLTGFGVCLLFICCGNQYSYGAGRNRFRCILHKVDLRSMGIFMRGRV